MLRDVCYLLFENDYRRSTGVSPPTLPKQEYMSGTPARRYRAAKRDAHHIINLVVVVRFYRFSFYVSVYILD
jgi:hypothetical protein